MLKGEAFVINCSEKKEYEKSVYYFVSLMLDGKPINTTSKVDLKPYEKTDVKLVFSVAQYGKELKVRVYSVA